MIKIHIATAIIILLVMEYLRRKYIDKKVREEVQASLMQNDSTSAFKNFNSSKSNTSRVSNYDYPKYRASSRAWCRV